MDRKYVFSPVWLIMQSYWLFKFFGCPFLTANFYDPNWYFWYSCWHSIVLIYKIISQLLKQLAIDWKFPSVDIEHHNESKCQNDKSMGVCLEI